MPIDPAILNEIEHLRDLGEKEKASLAEKIDLLQFSPEQPVFGYGDPGHALYIIRSGQTETFVKNDQGEKLVLEITKPGDIFGEISLIDDGPRTASVSAVTDVELLRLDRAHFEDYVRQYPPAALNLLSVAARRLRKSDEMIRRTTTRNANDVTDEQRTVGTRIADAVPSFTGSIGSLAFHALFFVVWIVVNVSLIRWLKVFDPFPFSFLSIIISLESIFLTLFVLTSQNRQSARDRIRSDIEFESSMNTEMKIATLHEKIDKLTESHYQVLVNTQKLLTNLQRGQ
jgi:CRP/FNR family transcriptional regulator, cyclic AMP receptor protein